MSQSPTRAPGASYTAQRIKTRRSLGGPKVANSRPAGSTSTTCTTKDSRSSQTLEETWTMSIGLTRAPTSVSNTGSQTKTSTTTPSSTLTQSMMTESSRPRESLLPTNSGPTMTLSRRSSGPTTVTTRTWARRSCLPASKTLLPTTALWPELLPCRPWAWPLLPTTSSRVERAPPTTASRESERVLDRSDQIRSNIPRSRVGDRKS